MRDCPHLPEAVIHNHACGCYECICPDCGYTDAWLCHEHGFLEEQEERELAGALHEEPIVETEWSGSPQPPFGRRSD